MSAQNENGPDVCRPLYKCVCVWEGRGKMKKKKLCRGQRVGLIGSCHCTSKCNTKGYLYQIIIIGYRFLCVWKSNRAVNGPATNGRIVRLNALRWIRHYQFLLYLILIHSLCRCAPILRSFVRRTYPQCHTLPISVHFNLITISIIADAAMHSNHTTDLPRMDGLYILPSLFVASLSPSAHFGSCWLNR